MAIGRTLGYRGRDGMTSAIKTKRGSVVYRNSTDNRPQADSYSKGMVVRRKRGNSTGVIRVPKRGKWGHAE